MWHEYFWTMKIICPNHKELIDVPDEKLLSGLKSQMNGLVFNCPVCGAEVLITNIQREIIIDREYGC